MSLSTSSSSAAAADSLIKADSIAFHFFTKFFFVVNHARATVDDGASPGLGGGQQQSGQGSVQQKVDKWFNLETPDSDLFTKEQRDPYRNILSTLASSSSLPPPRIPLPSHPFHPATPPTPTTRSPSSNTIPLPAIGPTPTLFPTPPPPLEIQVLLTIPELMHNQVLVHQPTPQSPRRRIEPVPRHILLETWTLAFTPSPLSSPSSSSTSAPGRGTSLAQQEDIALPTIYKHGIPLFRSLFSLLRILPAWKLYKRLRRNRNGAHFGIQLRVNPTPSSAQSSTGHQRTSSFTSSTTTGILLFTSYPSPTAPGPLPSSTHIFPPVPLTQGHTLTLQATYLTSPTFYLDDLESLLSSRFLSDDDYSYAGRAGDRDASSGRRDGAGSGGFVPTLAARGISSSAASSTSLGLGGGGGVPLPGRSGTPAVGSVPIRPAMTSTSPYRSSPLSTSPPRTADDIEKFILPRHGSGPSGSQGRPSILTSATAASQQQQQPLHTQSFTRQQPYPSHAPHQTQPNQLGIATSPSILRLRTVSQGSAVSGSNAGLGLSSTSSSSSTTSNPTTATAGAGTGIIPSALSSSDLPSSPLAIRPPSQRHTTTTTTPTTVFPFKTSTFTSHSPSSASLSHGTTAPMNIAAGSGAAGGSPLPFPTSASSGSFQQQQLQSRVGVGSLPKGSPLGIGIPSSSIAPGGGGGALVGSLGSTSTSSAGSSTAPGAAPRTRKRYSSSFGHRYNTSGGSGSSVGLGGTGGADAGAGVEHAAPPALQPSSGSLAQGQQQEASLPAIQSHFQVHPISPGLQQQQSANYRYPTSPGSGTLPPSPSRHLPLTDEEAEISVFVRDIDRRRPLRSVPLSSFSGSDDVTEAGPAGAMYGYMGARIPLGGRSFSETSRTSPTSTAAPAPPSPSVDMSRASTSTTEMLRTESAVDEKLREMKRAFEASLAGLGSSPGNSPTHVRSSTSSTITGESSGSSTVRAPGSTARMGSLSSRRGIPPLSYAYTAPPGMGDDSGSGSGSGSEVIGGKMDMDGG